MTLKTLLTAFALVALVCLPAAMAGAYYDAQGLSFLSSDEREKTATTTPTTFNICNRTRHIRIALLLHSYLRERDYDCAAVPTEALARIQTLRVRGRLTELKPGDFDGLTGMQHLDLSGNQLPALSAGIFDGLTTLRQLDLNGNQLSTLSVGVFGGLTGLQRLDLNGNRLSALPVAIFDELTGLRQLDLSGNRLSALPPGIFDWLIILQTLDLRDNHLVGLQRANPLFDYLPRGVRLLLSSQSRSPASRLDEPPPYRLRLWLPCDG